MVSSKHEDLAVFVIDGAGKSKVLRSRDGLLFTVAVLFEPFGLLWSHPHDVDVVVWSNVCRLGVTLNASVKEED
jgi:hypothetical protein